MERSRFNRHGADCVVGAVVRAHFIDWQQLDQFESNLRRPINEFTEHSDVADSQIIFTSQPKQRRQNAGNLFIRGQIHSAEMLSEHHRGLSQLFVIPSDVEESLTAVWPLPSPEIFRDVSTPLDMTRKNQLRFTSQSST